MPDERKPSLQERLQKMRAQESKGNQPDQSRQADKTPAEGTPAIRRSPSSRMQEPDANGKKGADKKGEGVILDPKTTLEQPPSKSDIGRSVRDGEPEEVELPSPASLINERTTTPGPSNQTIDLTEEDIIDASEEKKQALRQMAALPIKRRLTRLESMVIDTNLAIDVLKNELGQEIALLRTAMTAAFAEGKAAEKANKTLTSMTMDSTDQQTKVEMDSVHKMVQQVRQNSIRYAAMHKAWVKFEADFVRPLGEKLREFVQTVKQIQQDIEQIKGRKGSWVYRIFGK